jgi:hypothetical protein
MKKSIKHALYSGLLLPGIGQWKNGDKIKAYIFILFVVLIVGGFTYSMVVIMSGYFKALMNLEGVMDPTAIIRTHLTAIMKSFVYWGLAGAIIWAASGLDAYLVAKKKWGDAED